MIRRLVYGVNMIFLHDSPYIQVILNSSISWSNLLYLVIYRPYQTKIMNFTNISQELNIFVIFSMLGMALIPGISGILYDLIDWALTIMLYVSISLPVCINLLVIIRTWMLGIKCNNKAQVAYTDKPNHKN
jgi:hypothetical protein